MIKGLTTLEILIAVSVLIMLSVIVIGSFGAFRGARELDQASDDIVGFLREARSRTLASEDGSQFGVHFETSRTVLFKGNTFVDGALENKTAYPPRRVEIFNINIAGSNVLFERLTGRANPNGDVSVRLKSSPGQIRIIIIESSGNAYVQ